MRGDRDGFEAAREHAATGRDQRAVVVGPGRARQVEQALAFNPGGGRIGVGVDEDVAVVEGDDQAGVLGQQHAVAEHVARHVADAHAGEVLVLAVAPEREEMALDRFPRAARGDAHALVAVAHRAAGGEGVAQPEALVQRQAVGDVGESRRALVCRDDQVGIVLVVAHHVRRRHDLAFDDVVGDVEHRADEKLVAIDALGLHRFAVGGRALDEKAALGTHRHDDGVLHHLRLHQTQHLGAEVLAAIRPAQAAARHRAEAQVGAFHARAVDEDFAVGARLGRFGHRRGVDLERDDLLRAGLLTLVEAGAQGCEHRGLEAAQDAVLVDALDPVQHRQQRLVRGVHLGVAPIEARGDDRLDRLHRGLIGTHQRLQFDTEILLAGGLLRAVLVRMEACFEQFDQETGNERIARQRFFHVALRERHPDLQQVLGVAAQHGDLTPVQACGQDQAVEPVALGAPAPDVLEGLFEARAHGVHVDRADGLDLEVLDEGAGIIQVQGVGALGLDAQPEVFQQRQCLGKRDVAAGAVDLEAQLRRPVLGAVQVEVQTEAIITLQRGEADHVVGRHLGCDFRDIAGRQGAGKTVGEFLPFGFAAALHEVFTQGVVPAANDASHLLVEVIHVYVLRCTRLGADDHVHLRQRRRADVAGGVDLLAVECRHQEVLDALADLGVEAVARYVGQDRKKAAEAVAAQEQARADPFLQRQHAHRGAVQFARIALEQFVARQDLEDLAQGLAAVAVWCQPRLVHHEGVALAHQRNVPGTRAVRAGGEQADEAAFAGRAPGGIELEHADVVHVAGAVHRGAGVGLGQDQCVRFALRGGERVEHAAHRARAAGALVAAQKAQAAFRQGAQDRVIGRGAQRVLAIAQEHEVVVRDPAQEFAGFVHALARQARTGLRQVFGAFKRAIAHGAPIGDAGAHVIERREDGALKAKECRRADLAVDLDVHHRFGGPAAQSRGDTAGVALHVDHRVAEDVDADLGRVEHHADRVHEEGHVVVGDLDHRVRRLPAVRLQRRVEDAQGRRSRRTLLQEFEVSAGECRPCSGRADRVLLRLHAGIERPREKVGVVCLVGRHAAAQRVEDRPEPCVGCRGG